MPSGAAVVRYDGKNGTSWRIKYRDSRDLQIMETLGKSPEWNRRKAEAALRHRLADVEREDYKRPKPVTFGSFAAEWLEGHIEAKGLKRSTAKGYRQLLANHLGPTFGTVKLGEIEAEQVDRFVVTKRRAGLSPATCNRSLNLLSLVLNAALKRGLVRVNAVSLVDRPKEARRRWTIFGPPEVASVERAFSELIAEAENDRDRDDFTLTHRLFVFHMGTGVRRGEAAGLRWRSVFLADPDGPVVRIEETWVRSATDTPKSEAGHRTISLGSRVAAELWDHRTWSSYRTDDDYVFCNPRTGRPFDANRYGELVHQAVARAGVEGYVRPSHDLRHSSITNAAAAGTAPEALMSRAGHSSYATTRRYIDLAGVRFREEADRLEDRLWGGNGRKTGYKAAPSQAIFETEEAANPLGVSGGGGI